MSKLVWTYVLGDEVDDEMAAGFIEAAAEEHAAFPTSNWRIVINTDGGDIHAGSAIYDTIRQYSERGGGTHHVTTVVRGRAWSMGALLLQAGDVRQAGKYSSIMFHECGAHICESSLADAVKYTVHLDDWKRSVLTDIAARAGMEYEKAVVLLGGDDQFFSAEQAVELRLIDEIA